MAKFNPENVRAKIVADYTLFSKFLFDLETIEDNTQPTLCTNGKWIKYNQQFMDRSNPSDQFFKYMHEVAHVFLGHHIRVRPEHQMEHAQKAADYAVNDLLKDAGLRLPHDALWSSKFMGMGYEEIYRVLCKQNSGDSWSPDKHGKVESEPDDAGSEDNEDEGNQDPQAKGNKESKQKERLEQHAAQQMEAIQQAKMMGNMTDDLMRALEKLTETPTDWRDLLPDMIEDAFGMEDYTYMQPDRMYDCEIIMPGMIGEKRGIVALAGDTSISISTKQLKGIANEVMTLISNAKPEKTYMIWCDAKVKSVQEFDGMDDPELHPVGGGGTDFRPPFVWLEEEGIQPTCLVYLTDGFCTRYPEDPGYPVIWVIWQDREKITPPFGRVVVMHDNKF